MTETETGYNNACTLIKLASGKADIHAVLIKNNAGFLCGKIVVWDVRQATVEWIEDELYRFSALAPVICPKSLDHDVHRYIECPECEGEKKIKVRNLKKHLKNQHFYRMLEDWRY